MRLLCGALLVAANSVAAASCGTRPAEQKPAVYVPPVGQSAAAERIVLTRAEIQRALAMGYFVGPVTTILNVHSQLHYGDYRWDDFGEPPGRVWISIDLHRQLLSVFRGPNEIGTAVILYGAHSNETPIGTFVILAKFRNHRSVTYDGASMPYTLRLTSDGVSIHGSNVREGFATHGCIGVPIQFAAKLFNAASVGDDVIIFDRDRAKAS